MSVRWTGDGRLVLERAGAMHEVAALLFDLGGTLDADGLGWGERFAALWRETVPELDAEALRAALDEGERAVLCHPRAAALGLGDMVSLHVEAHRERLGAAAVPHTERIETRFRDETRDRLAAHAPLLERLAARLPLGVVSNGCGNTARLLREAGLEQCFRVVVDSSEVDAWKPDPRIFAPALARLGCDAAHVAMVGDRLDRDVEGAAAAGLRAIWVSGGRPLAPAHPLAHAVDAVVAHVRVLDPGAAR